MVNTELAKTFNTVAQPALLQAVERQGAVGAGFGTALQHRQLNQVFLQPWGFNRASRQPGDAHKGDDIFRLGICQHAFEIGMRIGLFGDCKWRTDLHGTGSQ